MSIAPISSKRIELSGAPNTGVGQTHNQHHICINSTSKLMEFTENDNTRLLSQIFSENKI